MTMKTFLIAFLIAIQPVISTAQNWPLKKMVEENFIIAKGIDKIASPFNLNNVVAGKAGSYDILWLKQEFIDDVLFTKPATLELAIPSSSGTYYAQLVRTDLGNIKFSENRRMAVENVKEPVCYMGILKNEGRKNSVFLTVNEDYFSASIVLPDKNLQVSKSTEPGSADYLFFNAGNRSATSPPMNCGTTKQPSEAAMRAIEQSASVSDRILDINSKVFYVFIECFDSLYQWRGSNYQQTINYVYDLFNTVAAGYLNEQVRVKISGINIWTTPDPYRQDNRENALADLAAYYQDNFWGNICVGLDYSINTSDGGRSGIAGAIGRMKGDEPYSCPAYSTNNHQFCYNDMNYFGNYQNYPAASIAIPEQTYLVMHEMGHLFGSAHTHWCGWVLTTVPVIVRGALDNCNAVEPICSSTCTPADCSTCPPCAAGPAPTNGGTVMSYCLGTGEYVNYNNGFGTIPGNAIRNYLDNFACASTIPFCTSTRTVGNLGTGVHRFEASGTITANGIISSGSYTTMDAGSKITLAPGFRANGGSRVKLFIEGCGGIR